MNAFREIWVPSSLDGSSEPSLLFLPEAPATALCVGLHTWSYDRFNQAENMLPFCRDRGWALLLPEFRGPNLRTNPRVTQAGGSALARRDVIDAASWVLQRHLPPGAKTFLMGGSGGGHVALLVAARESFAWSAVSIWCPITDLVSWHGETCLHTDNLEAVCGGPPGINAAIDREYAERSPLYYAEALAGARLQLAHGRHDKLVFPSHSWNLAKRLERAGGGTFYFHIFDGGHEINYRSAFAFFDGLPAAEAEKTGSELTR